MCSSSWLTAALIGPFSQKQAIGTIRRRALRRPGSATISNAPRRARPVLAIGEKNRGADAPPILRHDEAHLPAKETQAGSRPRVPGAHEHPRRAPDAEAPARQGTQAAVDLRALVARTRRTTDTR